MRIAVLANPDNVHSRRWIEWLIRRGHEVLVVADPHTTERLEALRSEPGVGGRLRVEVARWGLLANILAFRLTPRPHGNSLWKFLAYRRILRTFRPDVVHGMEAYYNGLALAWSGPWAKVLTPWGKDVHEDARRGPLWRWIIRRALCGADIISTNDEALPEFLLKEFAIPPEKALAFSWGVDLSVFHRRPDAAAALRAELGIDPGAPVILSPRRFDPYWGAETIIEAIPEVLHARPDARFVILAGEGPEDFRDQMRARVKELGVGGAVRWILQRNDPPRMAGLYSMADVFVSIPKTDLLAMTVLEGMACGSYPVLADLPAYRKRLDETNAELVNDLTPSGLAAAVVKALPHEVERRTATEKNVALMIDLEDAEKNMPKMEEVYREAIRRATEG